ncbi:protein of unknown function [Pseudomonas mediterranea]
MSYSGTPVPNKTQWRRANVCDSAWRFINRGMIVPRYTCIVSAWAGSFQFFSHHKGSGG